MTYSELQVTTHFSFLRGASSCEQLFAQAAVMGMPALGIVDRNSVAGVVRALYASDDIERKHGIRVRSIPGCRLDLVCGTSLLVWPEDKAAWSRLTTLLTRGKLRADPRKGEKGQCFLHWEDVADHAAGLIGALVCDAEPERRALAWMADLFGSERGHVCLTHHRRPGDALRLRQTTDAARDYGLSPLATGDVLYHEPDQRMLQDVVTAIRHGCTIDDLGLRRERSIDRHLKPPQEMARRFADYPDALRAVEHIVERCQFSLRELSYQYPDEIIMSGRTPQDALAKLAHNALAQRFAGYPPEAYRNLLRYELNLVEKWNYAPYFLTVNSIVSYARSIGILCQGRGSAANSMICFVLGITSIDPIKHKLLFERFISEDRREPPDIDVDFEHERREEIIQWIYRTYGRDHAAMTAVVSRFRARGAVREVGKVMGLSEDMTAALAGQVWGWSEEGVKERHVDQLNLDKTDPRLALTLELAKELIGTPRHLSQHPGGFILTQGPLAELLPIEPAAMVDRHVVEWEKADIEELRLMKVDILGLGMLGCMRRAFDLLERHKGLRLTMASDEMQHDCPKTFAMIQRADTLGVFQIESRAQMSMLPRMKPERFYDLVIEVAIVRPGPIQGDMVHPYLKRREGSEKVEYPNEALKTVLEDTLGIPLFQEQAMKVAIHGAGFTPSEADSLRKAMATFKFTGGVGEFHDRLITGMKKNGISLDFAERLVKQIEGFGSYGFPESHAASFAKIAYASCWMKCHHPDVFCAALLNAQPMGFYAPAQIVRDAREHGVVVEAVCVNGSAWDTIILSSSLPIGGEGGEEGRCLTETGIGGTAPLPALSPAGRGLRKTPARFAGSDADWADLRPIRLGLKIVAGLAEADADAILAARAAGGPFASIPDVFRRARVKPAALERLARADAFRCFGHDRRQALWAVKALGEKSLPLLDAMEVREPTVALTPLTAGREVVEDYRSTQLSLRAHPLSFLRPRLERAGIVPASALSGIRDGRKVEVAGVILVRQKPGSAKGVLFITIEDETGVANAILWPDRFEAQRTTVMSATMIGVQGRVQKEGLVIHVIVDRIVDYSWMLREVGDADLPRLTTRGDGATHGGSPDRGDPGWQPRVRSDYHKAFRTGCDPEDAIRIKSRDFH
ncbi:DNA polymerase [Sphingomonas sp. Leaf33]|uniref:error-prone DNA polymerase n=1 Tax=Sphingomonas sp. Leaf33 TaxID=1736215 RepID=UPI0006FD7996|nr:error-prone DNA polymerase [Sphingomonas sp. Leaf33]KQN19322.1 DNA polymerase [Sphingomonas sp. Leaf33]